MKLKRILSILAVTLSINFISPIFSEKANAAEVPPTIIGDFAITIDADTGEVIYAKSADEKSFPASITKLMTAILLAENKEKTDVLPFTQTALSQPDYSLYRSYGPITLGTTMTADDVMKSLLLFSGNDIAYVVSDAVSNSTEEFADLMNSRFKDWGLTSTHFTNPNGLHDPEHYTTPYELSLIAQKAYENQWVREVMALQKATVTTSNNLPIELENRNKNVGLDGCIGGKTGFTDPAGRCLAAIYERDGRTIIGVVMRSAYDAKDVSVFNDMKAIIDYSYEAEKTTIQKASEPVGNYEVTYKAFKFFGPEKTVSVPMTLTEDVTIYDNEINTAEASGNISVSTKDAWELAKNPEGTYTVSVRNNSKNYTLKADISTSDLLKENLVLYVIAAVIILLALVLLFFIIKLIKNGPRRSRGYRGSRRRRRY